MCGIFRAVALSGGNRLADAVIGKDLVGLCEANEAMEICARDAEAASGQGFVSIVLADCIDGQLDFVVAELALKGAGRLVVGDVDDFVEGGVLFMSRILRLRSSARTARPGARIMARCMTFSSSRTLPGQE